MPASWPEAFAVAARGLQARAGRVGVLTGGRLTGEDAYAYSKFARVALGTNDIDFRARPHSAEEADFLAAHVVGTGPRASTYADLEQASVVLLAGFEPEDESPIVFLRLRKAARTGRTRVVSIAPFTSRGLQQDARHAGPRPLPGDEPAALEALAHDGEVALDARRRDPGRRAARDASPARCPRPLTLAGTTGARLAWVPRRAGERGALETGCLPNLLPGGRPVADAGARVDLGTVWGVAPSRTRPAATADAILAAAAAGELTALVVGGVDPDDLPDPRRGRGRDRGRPASWSASRSAPAPSPQRADVVFPVAPVAEKAGMFVDWEGRVRPFDKVLRDSHALPDLRVLAGIADEMGVRPRLPHRRRGPRRDAGARRLGRRRAPPMPDGVRRSRRPGDADRPTARLRLATWKLLIDDGRMLDGERLPQGHRAYAGRAGVARARWTPLGLTAGEHVTVTGDHGHGRRSRSGVADLPDGVVWAADDRPARQPPGPTYDSRPSNGDGGQA